MGWSEGGSIAEPWAERTGVYVCDENERHLPKQSLKAFDRAVDEYFAAVKRPSQ